MSVVMATGTANVQAPLLLHGGPREQPDFEFLAVENVRLSRENQHLREQWTDALETAEAIECDAREVQHGNEPAPSALRLARVRARRAACAVVSCAGAGLLVWLGLAPLLCDIYGVGSGVDAHVASAVGSVAVPRRSQHPTAVATGELKPDLARAKISIDQLMHSAFPGASYRHLKTWNPMFKDASFSNSPDCALVISYAPVPHGRTRPLQVASAYMDTSGLAVPYGDDIQSVMGLTELLGTYQHYQRHHRMESQNPYLVISSDIYGYADEMHYQFVECALLGWPNVTGLSTGEFPLRVVVKNRQHGTPCRRHTADYAPCDLETSWGRDPKGGKWRSTAKEINELFHLCTTKYLCDIEQAEESPSHGKEAPQVFFLRANKQAAVKKAAASGANGRHKREDSCAANGCIAYNVSLPCQCHDDCKLFDSCCSDYTDVCGAMPGGKHARTLNKAVGTILAMAGVTTSPPHSCAVLGCVGYDKAFACQCNHDCWRFGSCCHDYWAACKIRTSTVTTSTSTSVTSTTFTKTITTSLTTTSLTTTSTVSTSSTTTSTTTVTTTHTTKTHTTTTVTRTTVTRTTIKPFVLRTPPPPHPPIPSRPELPGSRTRTRSRRPAASDEDHANLLDKAEKLVTFTAQSWTPWQSHV